jgi:hypothetical protein
MKVQLRNNDSHPPSARGVINLPSSVWKPLGWKINDMLDIHVIPSSGDPVVIIMPRTVK